MKELRRRHILPDGGRVLITVLMARPDEWARCEERKSLAFSWHPDPVDGWIIATSMSLISVHGGIASIAKGALQVSRN